jgi:hypothetical protein
VSGRDSSTGRGPVRITVELDAATLDAIAESVAEQVARRLSPEAGSAGDWLDTRAAAGHLGVHPDTLRRLANSGAVPFEQDGPGCKLHFRRGDLDRWRSSGGASTTLPRTLKSLR